MDVNFDINFGFKHADPNDGIYDPVSDARAVLREEFPNVPREMIEGGLANASGAAKATTRDSGMPDSSSWESIAERDWSLFVIKIRPGLAQMAEVL